MPDIVERAIRPYNPPNASVISKDEYTMFTPIASPTNAGMIAYNDGDFLLKDGVLYLSSTYRAKIERAIALGDWLPEQVKALELSISMAVGTKFAVTSSTSDVTVADKYLFLSEVGVLISEIPVESATRVYTFEYENASWYLVYDGLRRELESLAAIGLSVTPADYTSTFTVNTAYAAVGKNDIGYQANALYYSDQAASSATQAAGSATDAQDAADDAADANSNAKIAAQDAKAEALKAEGYALGKQNGVDVQQGSTYYQNNAYYFLKEAGRAVNDAKDYADSASGYATDAQNSAFFAELNKQSASAASAEAKEARDQARAARDEVLGALGDGVSVQATPNTIPKRDANGKLFAAAPTTTDSDNVVATKGFVNSSVSTNTANFLGTYTYTGTGDDHNAIAAWIPSQLPAGTILTNNDYVFVQMTVNGNTKYERYKYNSNDATWGYEYELNNSSFTAAQWAAINSGITSQDIAATQAALQTIDETLGQHQDDLDGLAQDINTLESGKQDVIDTNHKLASDLVDDTNSQTHKFVTPTEKATWNAKQAALTAGRNISLSGNIADFNIPFVVLSASAGDTIDVANGTVALSADHSAVFANNDFVRVQCNDLLTAGDTYVFQRTYNEPTNNNEKVEYFEYVDVGFYGNPLGIKAHQYAFFYTTGTTPITLGFIDHTADGGSASFEHFTNAEIDTAMFGTYTVTGSITNGTSTSATIIARTSATATITITPSTGYTLPTSVTVTNATLTSYDDTTGIVTVSNPTGNVSVTAVCESALVMPTKGDLISMTLGNDAPAAGTNNTYRVLKVNGTQAEVLAMFDTSISQVFNPSSNDNNTYAGSALDTYLNTDWYDSLDATKRSAIVSKTFTQDSWYTDTSGNPDYNCTYRESASKPTVAYQRSLSSATYGAEISRNVYALSIQDIIDYLEVTPAMTSANTTLTAANIWTMFWNTTSQPGTSTVPWLRSARAGDYRYEYCVYSSSALVSASGRVNDSHAARPAFTIDLSKISFTINA